MQKKLYRALSGIKENPYHLLVGLTMISIGVNMMIEPVRFVWPPFFDLVANDHGFDAAFIFAGLMIVYWTVSRSHHTEFDAAFLGIAGFLMATLTIYQLVHVQHTGIYMPWVQDAAITALIVILAVRSDSVERLD